MLKSVCLLLDLTAGEDEDYVLYEFPARSELSDLKGFFVATRDVIRAVASCDVQVICLDRSGTNQTVTAAYWHWGEVILVLAVEADSEIPAVVNACRQLTRLLLFMFGTLDAMLMVGSAQRCTELPSSMPAQEGVKSPLDVFVSRFVEEFASNWPLHSAFTEAFDDSVPIFRRPATIACQLSHLLLERRLGRTVQPTREYQQPAHAVIQLHPHTAANRTRRACEGTAVRAGALMDHNIPMCVPVGAAIFLRDGLVQTTLEPADRVRIYPRVYSRFSGPQPAYRTRSE
jgi:hypothetical protein